MTVVSEQNRIFQTDLNQTHSEPNLRFFKTKSKPNQNKKIYSAQP